MSSKSILQSMTVSLEKTEEFIRQRAYRTTRNAGMLMAITLRTGCGAEADTQGKKRSESASKPRAARAGAACEGRRNLHVSEFRATSLGGG